MRFRLSKQVLKSTIRVGLSKIHGIGLFAERPLKCGEIIIEYVGEIIRPCLTDQRERYYDSRSIGTYMFRIDDDVVVDATLTGNPGRFVNHSCDPNCASRIVKVENQKHIVIFAEKDIALNEELTYDYKVGGKGRKAKGRGIGRIAETGWPADGVGWVVMGLASVRAPLQFPLEESKISCHCGAATCRGFMN
jgi:SET domain-containing protein